MSNNHLDQATQSEVLLDDDIYGAQLANGKQMERASPSS